MTLKGFDVPQGYMGWVDSIQRYMLFASYRDYREYLEPRGQSPLTLNSS